MHNFQNVNDLLNLEPAGEFLKFGGTILFISVMMFLFILVFVEKKRIFITFAILTGLSSITSISLMLYTVKLSGINDEKINDLSVIINDSLHDKYEFDDFLPDEIVHPKDATSAEKTKNTFEYKVFSSDVINAPKASIVLNDDTRVTWAVIGDPDTGEVKFIGDGNTNPNDILKESE